MSFFRDLGRMLFEEEQQEAPSKPLKTVIHSLTNEQTLEQAFERSENQPVVIFKHSCTCPISAMARRRITFLQEENDPPVYEIVVQSARSLSNKLEQELGIHHESPQVIIIHKQQPVYNTSHGMITVDNIRAAIFQATKAQ